MAPELKDELLAWVADPDNTPFPDAAVASAVAAHFAQWETILNRLVAGFDGWWEIHGPQLEALAEQLETAATQTIGATPMEMKNPHTELTEAAQALKDAQTDDGARVALDRIDPDILGFAWLLRDNDSAGEADRPFISTKRSPVCVEVGEKQVRADTIEWYVATDRGNYGPCDSFADALELAHQVKP